MSDFSATDVAFAGFRFVRGHPKTVGLWAAIQLVISALTSLVMTATVGPSLMQLEALRGNGDPQASLALFLRLAPMYLVTIPLALLFYAVIYAAVSRAGLKPQEERFGYLRLGGDEIRQFLLILLAVLVAIGFEIACIVVVLVLVAVLAMVAKPLAGLAGFLCAAAASCAVLFFGVRLSLASPLTFDSRRVNLFGSWALTRGRFWKMLGTYLLVAGLALVIFLLLLIIQAGLAGATGGVAGLASMFRPDMSSPGAFFTPARIVLLFVGAAANAVMWPVLLLPPVEMYRALNPHPRAPF